MRHAFLFKINPPHTKDHQQRPQTREHKVHIEKMLNDTALHRLGRGQNGLAQDDQSQQTITLGNMMRMPRRHHRFFRPHRHQQLKHHQQQENRQKGR